jgi:hypothetical protein
MAYEVGILAYGSLIDDPGVEISGAIVHTLKEGIVTPFKVEFARTSSGREGAPTLVPVARGGANVRAQIFVLNVGTEEATNRLWRRERNIVCQVDQVYVRPAQPRKNHVLVDALKDFHAVKTVLYTRVGQNIETPTAAILAEYAVKSARKLRDGRDGISYLIAARRNGIETPLSGPYEEEIKRRTNTTNLEDALASCR